MIAEERLRRIVTAADPDDRDDVMIRTSLAAALEASSIDFVEPLMDRIPGVPSLCELRAGRRAAPRGSRPLRLGRRAFNH